MKVLFCGGALEVGASCILVSINGKNILFDAGIRMTKGNELPDFNLIKENGGVDAIFISHAHMDHGGSLPIISSEYPNAIIYMTHATKDLLKTLLYDSLKIMEMKEEEIPTFAEVHVRNALNRIICYSPNFSFNPFKDDLTVTFFNAGHIMGAVCIYVTSNEGSIFYSGDFSITPQMTVEGASIKKIRPDIAIFESTYGDRLHSDRRIEEDKLVNIVKETIEKGNKILIPAFALGRAQEVILILKRAINQNKLSTFNIYVDGLVKDMCRNYRLNPNYLKNQLAKKVFKEKEIFYDDNVIPVTTQKQREEIINKKEGLCIVSSSGMLTGGPSQWYAIKLALDENNYIAITGYQDEESPGRQLLDIADLPSFEEKSLNIGGNIIPIKCKIGKYGLSAHGDKNEIISLIHLASAKNVFLVHGNKEVITNLALEVQRDFRGEVIVPSNGEIFERDINIKRKQKVEGKFKSLNKKYILDEDLKELWQFININYGNKVAFTIEDLIYILKGEDTKEDDYSMMKDLINNSNYFESEIRRPFMYHIVLEESLKTLGSEFMEVNQMLSLVDEYFPTETGLYKKGAKFEEKIVLLYFNFPKKQAPPLSDKILEFESLTKWKVELNDKINLNYAKELIYLLFLENYASIEKISYFESKNYFVIKFNKTVDNFDDMKKKFYEDTGLEIRLDEKEKNENLEAVLNSFQMEQNEALTLIQTEFDRLNVKIYKKSIKVINGEYIIEVSFITPTFGERYRDILDILEYKTKWKINIGEASNQYELFNIARLLFMKNKVSVIKNPSYYGNEMEVRVQVSSIEEDVLKKITEEFKEITGIKLVVNIKR